MNEMPAPIPPRRLTGMLRMPNAVKRTTRSIIQASARATGPARRRLSSMPSGVGMSRAVSSIAAGALRRRVPAKLAPLRGVDIAVPGVDRSKKDGCDRERKRDHQDDAQAERDEGENPEHDDERDTKAQSHQAIDQERHDVLQAAEEACADR